MDGADPRQESVEGTSVSQADLRHLRQAITLARRARERGNGPFGALLVDERGNVLLEAENTRFTASDSIGHAEINLLRETGRRFPPEVLARCTLYANAEPCAMCAGAIFWSGVGRVVFALGLPRLWVLAGNPVDQLGIRCAEVLATGHRPVEVVGPAIEDDAAAIFDGYSW
jgi:tRNA(adenine34) deaminase